VSTVEELFAKEDYKIGSTLRIRLPNDYSITSGRGLSPSGHQVTLDSLPLYVAHTVDAFAIGLMTDNEFLKGFKYTPLTRWQKAKRMVASVGDRISGAYGVLTGRLRAVEEDCWD
jgi:hypothetical protein